MGFGLLLGLVLAYGAAITSLGLAAATWVRRLGRAVALCVTSYVLCVDRLADLGDDRRGWMVGEHHHRDDDRRSSIRRVRRHAGRLGVEFPDGRLRPT